MMRLLFIINTPAQAHTWRNTISELLKREHIVKILARDYGSTPGLLADAGFQPATFKPVGSRSWRLLGALGHFQKCYRLSKGFYPSIFIGFGVDAAVTAMRFRKPSIIFTDDDHTYFQNRLTRLMASSILTPESFIGKFGEKHVRVKGYKELAYLHPNYFKPDITIYDELKIPRGEKYVILRFNILDAIHDIGSQGFSERDKFNLVKELEKYAHVFISPEGPLSEELDKNRLKIPYNRIHHALYYAQMVAGDTGTMATEAAVLGTPGITYNTNTIKIGIFHELNSKYDLLYYFTRPQDAIKKAIGLIQEPYIKERWALKRQKLLNDKVDITRFLVDFIENYPESFKDIKGEKS